MPCSLAIYKQEKDFVWRNHVFDRRGYITSSNICNIPKIMSNKMYLPLLPFPYWQHVFLPYHSCFLISFSPRLHLHAMENVYGNHYVYFNKFRNKVNVWHKLSYFIDIPQPLHDIFKCFFVSNIINKHNPHSSSVIWCGNSVKSLLPSCVPGNEKVHKYINNFKYIHGNSPYL